MNDWRSKPRNGKAEFMKHLAFIEARVASGETQAAIYGQLKLSDGLTLSPSQFNRYINKLVMTQAQPKATHATAVPAPIGTLPLPALTGLEPSAQPKGAALTPADLKKIREEPIDMKALSRRVQR